MSESAGRGLFVTGTGTGVGKTILSASLIAGMVSAGESVRAHKPIVTGLDEPPGRWPADHELLGSLSGMGPERVAPLRFGPAVSPHLAAELAGMKVDPGALVESARGAMEAARAAGEILVVEGVGGLLVPLAEGLSVCDLAAALGLPVLVASHAGLGTINHTLLTLQAARRANLRVAAVVLGPWEVEHPSVEHPQVEHPQVEHPQVEHPQVERSRRENSLGVRTKKEGHARVGSSNRERIEPLRMSMESSNRQTIERLGEVEVAQMSFLDGPDRAGLAEAGSALAWREWLQDPGTPAVVPTMGR